MDFTHLDYGRARVVHVDVVYDGAEILSGVVGVMS